MLFGVGTLNSTLYMDVFKWMNIEMYKTLSDCMFEHDCKTNLALTFQGNYYSC